MSKNKKETAILHLAICLILISATRLSLLWQASIATQIREMKET